jgi:hypothetical protein
MDAHWRFLAVVGIGRRAGRRLSDGDEESGGAAGASGAAGRAGAAGSGAGERAAAKNRHRAAPARLTPGDNAEAPHGGVERATLRSPG